MQGHTSLSKLGNPGHIQQKFRIDFGCMQTDCDSLHMTVDAPKADARSTGRTERAMEDTSCAAG